MYTLSDLLKNLVRYARRYVPFALIIILLFSVNIAVRCIGHETDAIVQTVLDRYGTEFYVVNLDSPVTDPAQLEFLDDLPYVTSAVRTAALHRLDHAVPRLSSYVYEADRMMIALADPAALAASLSDGRLYEAAEECCLNETWFQELHLALGDTVELDDPRTGHTITLHVVGVIEELNAPYSLVSDYTARRVYTAEENVRQFWDAYGARTPYPDCMNELYTDAKEKGQLRAADIDLAVMRVTEGYDTVVTLDSYQNADALREAVRAQNSASQKLGQRRGRNWMAGETVSGIRNLTAPMQRIGTLCAVISAVTLAVSLLVILLLTVLIVSARRYEIGICRCIGITAAGVCRRFAAEMLMFLCITAAAGFSIGVPAAMIFSRALSLTVTAASIRKTGVELLALLVGMGFFASIAASAAVLVKRPMEILNSRT